jgi:hypothetical protein
MLVAALITQPERQRSVFDLIARNVFEHNFHGDAMCACHAAGIKILVFHQPHRQRDAIDLDTLANQGTDPTGMDY